MGPRSLRKSTADTSTTGVLVGAAVIWRRLTTGALILIVAAPVLPLAHIAGWLVGYALAIVAEQAVADRRPKADRDLPSLLASFLLSAANAWPAALLIGLGDGGARMFALLLLAFSCVSIVVRTYSMPRLFAVAIAPHALVLAALSWSVFSAALNAGDYLRALTPPATLILFFVTLLPTRRVLSDAFHRLAEARQSAEQASQAKSEFLATMSHEIRTPLNGVLGMAQAMQRDELVPAQREKLRVIRRSGEALLSILNDVLDLSKIEEGQLTLEAVEFDMEHCARGAVATFTPLAEKKGLSFEFSISDEAMGRYVGDGVRLRQILYNLVANAVKFTDAGGVGVCVSYADGRLQLEVADSGVGIPRARIEALFEKFVQGDASTTRRHGGSGLGLTICRRLAELMGGTVSASSVEGKGSLFVVSLPLERVAAAALAAAPALPEAQPEAAPVRILAAEDNQVNQLVLKTLLSQAGLEPTMVQNGADAVEAWKSGAWDLILMDIQMPVMDGIAATRAIRAAEAAERRPRTPIIAVTANAMAHQLGEYAAAGMDLVVPKPLDAATLFDAIERTLNPAQDEAAAAA